MYLPLAGDGDATGRHHWTFLQRH